MLIQFNDILNELIEYLLKINALKCQPLINLRYLNERIYKLKSLMNEKGHTPIVAMNILP